VVDINKQIKDITIKFKRKYAIKLPDAIIAATAQYLGTPLLSADKDFLSIKEINFIVYERT